MRWKILVFFMLIASSSYSSDFPNKFVTIKTKDILLINNLGLDDREKFFSDSGQFQILIPKERFPVKAPNCRKNIILRMVGVDFYDENRERKLENNWKLRQIIEEVSEGKRVSFTVPLESKLYMKRDKNGQPVLQYCNAFIPSNFGKYTSDVEKSNPEPKLIEEKMHP